MTEIFPVFHITCHSPDVPVYGVSVVFTPHSPLGWKSFTGMFRSSVLKWIEAFLTTYHQRVLIDGEASDYTQVKSGVPQGTVLGPLLFLIFINDLPDEVVSNVRLFADDAVLYSEDCVMLQKDLDKLEWEDQVTDGFPPTEMQRCLT